MSPAKETKRAWPVRPKKNNKSEVSQKPHEEALWERQNNQLGQTLLMGTSQMKVVVATGFGHMAVTGDLDKSGFGGAVQESPDCRVSGRGSWRQLYDACDNMDK